MGTHDMAFSIKQVMVVAMTTLLFLNVSYSEIVYSTATSLPSVPINTTQPTTQSSDFPPK